MVLAGLSVSVREVTGKDIQQVVIGSSANPGLRDFWIVSEIFPGKITSDRRKRFDWMLEQSKAS